MSTCNPNTWEVDADGYPTSQPVHIKPFLKRKKPKKAKPHYGNVLKDFFCV